MSKSKPPQKPPPTSLDKLDIYGSPHFNYKESTVNDYITCDHKRKLLHEYLYPIVRENRIAACNFFTSCAAEVKKHVNSFTNYVTVNVTQKKNEIFKQARHPDNFKITRGIVASAAGLSFFYGMRRGRYKDSILKGTMYSTLTSLFTGYVCFPEGTDACIRNVAYYGALAGVSMYNIWASDNKQLTMPLPTKESLPKASCANKNRKTEIKRFPDYSDRRVYKE